MLNNIKNEVAVWPSHLFFVYLQQTIKNYKNMKSKEYPIENNGFEYNGVYYGCVFAIERDTKLIIQEAETSHKDSFDELYDRTTLKPEKIRVYVDEKGKFIYGFIVYVINYKNGSGCRYACGNYYPFWGNDLMPHPFQASICW